MINLNTQLLHKWVPTGSTRSLYTMCRKMKCGTPLAPSKYAQFETIGGLDEKHFTVCQTCFKT